MVVPGTTVMSDTSITSLPLSDTILTLKGPRPTSLYSTYACNGTTLSGYGHGCMSSTPSCEVTGMVTTMNVYGRYVIECTSSGSVTATPGTVQPSGIASVSLHHSPLPTSGVSTSTSTSIVSSATESTITTTPAATATATSNPAPRHSRPFLGVPAVLVLSWIGAFICSNIY